MNILGISVSHSISVVSLIAIILAVVVVWVFQSLVSAFVPMSSHARTAANVVAMIVVAILLLQVIRLFLN